MVNKCVAVGCRTGLPGSESVSSFRFPFTRPDLLKYWEQFVGRVDWTPKPNGGQVLCEKHFETKFMKLGKTIILSDMNMKKTGSETFLGAEKSQYKARGA